MPWGRNPSDAAASGEDTNGNTPDDTTATDATDETHDTDATDATSQSPEEPDAKEQPQVDRTSSTESSTSSDTETETETETAPSLPASVPHNVHNFRTAQQCEICTSIIKHGEQTAALPCEKHIIHSKCLTNESDAPKECMLQKCPSSSSSSRSSATQDQSLPKVILTVQDFEKDYPLSNYQETGVTYCLVCSGRMNNTTKARTMPCGHRAHPWCISSPQEIPDKCRFCRRDNHYRREQELLDGYDPALYSSQNLPVYPGRSDSSEEDSPPAHTPAASEHVELGLPTYEEATEWTEETK